MSQFYVIDTMTKSREQEDSITDKTLDGRRIWTPSFSRQLRSPDNSVNGHFACQLMELGHPASVDAVDALLGVKKEHTILEIGPGGGSSLNRILDTYHPKRAYAIEISDVFRAQLQSDPTCAKRMKDGILSIHGDDAARMPFIPSGSVDRVIGVNVLYFLNPLGQYLCEIYRILKPGGFVLFCVNDDISEHGDPGVYLNRNWTECVNTMKLAGLENSYKGESRLEKSLRYTPIYGYKPEA